MSNLLTLYMPLYYNIVALMNKGGENYDAEIEHWRYYWTLRATYECIFRPLEFILEWIPLWSALKILFFMACMSTKNSLSQKIVTKVVVTCSESEYFDMLGKTIQHIQSTVTDPKKLQLVIRMVVRLFQSVFSHPKLGFVYDKIYFAQSSVQLMLEELNDLLNKEE